MTELELVDDIIQLEDSDLNCTDVSGGASSADSATSANLAPAVSKGGASFRTADSTSGLELKSSTLCRGEVCQWHHGNYTLAGDPRDPGLGRFCLEANISFNSEGKGVVIFLDVNTATYVTMHLPW